MIKRIALLSRKPGTTHEEFVRHWTEVHGPLLASHPSVKRLIANDILEVKRFAVRNADEERPAQNAQPAFRPDGMWEIWFDSYAEMDAMYASDFSRALVADAEHFVGAFWSFIVEEHVLKEVKAGDVPAGGYDRRSAQSL